MITLASFVTRDELAAIKVTTRKVVADEFSTHWIKFTPVFRPNYMNSFVSSKTIFGATSSYYDVLHLTWTTKKRQLQIEMIDQLCNK
ncbi:hypothetical protein Hanom_Chr01g00019401 [Helianthus anomalus]